MTDETQQGEVEETTPPAEETTPPAEEAPTEEAAAEEPTVEEVQARTEEAVASAGQPTPEDQVPGYGDEPTAAPDADGSEARRVHPDGGGYQFTGNE